MAATWEAWAKRLRASWASGPKAQALLGAIGAVLGDQVDANSLAALLEQLPASATDPASVALALSERQIEPGPSLSLADRKALAAAAPNLNRLRGRALGLLLALYYADFQGAVLVQQNGLGYQITATPNLGDLFGLVAPPSWFTITTLANANPAVPASTDGRPAIPANTVPWWDLGNPMDAAGNQFASRFAVLFPLSLGTPDPGLGTAANLARIQRVIKAWRPAKTTCAGIIVATGPMYGWPPFHYGNAQQYGGTSTTYAGA
jgi:hypothetical protein